MTDEEYKSKKRQIKELLIQVNTMQKDIKKNYDEPIICLSCWWEGKKSELASTSVWDGEYPVCPKCRSRGWEVCEVLNKI